MDVFLTISLLILSVIAGGAIVTFLDSSNHERIIKLLLAFSGGFLLSIAFIHFIPELYEHSHVKVGIYILLGFLIQLLLEFFSGGIEHGHVHHHGHHKIPWAILIALGAHSFLEGIPLGGQIHGELIATSHHHDHDQSLLLGILFHRLPVAVALTTLLVHAKISTGKVWLLLLLFAITSPIGMLLGYNAHSTFEGFDFDIILAIVVGMFLHISTTIIFETSENHKFNFLKLISIMGGFAVAILIH